MSILAIIGAAGRGEDAAKLTLPVWNKMKRAVYDFVQERGIQDVISGGSAGADHLAVGLFNASIVQNLTLSLPCQFDWWKSQFEDTGSADWRANPGRRLNELHRSFSAVIGKPTLEEIKSAFVECQLAYGDGFFARNDIVAARADVMIAFTFGEGNKIADGGSAYTARKYLAKGGKSLWHVDLNTMKLYENGIVA